MCYKKSTVQCTHGKMKDFGLLALRVAVGMIFIYAGYGKLGMNHEMASGMFAKMIGPETAGSFWAYFVGSAELLGGLMVLLGVFATYAATWLSVIMVVAILAVHWNGAFSSMYAPLALLGACLALMGNGAGGYRLVESECCCPKCKEMNAKCQKEGGCCGGKCEDKK